MEEARIHQLSIINVIFITKSRVQSVEIGEKNGAIMFDQRPQL